MKKLNPNTLYQRRRRARFYERGLTATGAPRVRAWAQEQAQADVRRVRLPVREAAWREFRKEIVVVVPEVMISCLRGKEDAWS